MTYKENHTFAVAIARMPLPPKGKKNAWPLLLARAPNLKRRGGKCHVF